MLAIAVAIMLQKVSNASTATDDASVTAGLGSPSATVVPGVGDPLPTLPPGIAPIPIATVTVPPTVAPTSTATTVPPRPVTVKPPAAPPPTVPAGSPQAYARQQLAAHGWSDSQFNCLNLLWIRESNWNPRAQNRSGAYGIPQALPGEKMAAAGADWRTNYQTQINWGLGYIQARYGSPCGAWAHSQATGSY